MGIEVFAAPLNGRLAIDMNKVEAVMEHGEDVVMVVTSSDTYKVSETFGRVLEAFERSRKEPCE